MKIEADGNFRTDTTTALQNTLASLRSRAEIRSEKQGSHGSHRNREKSPKTQGRAAKSGD